MDEVKGKTKKKKFSFKYTMDEPPTDLEIRTLLHDFRNIAETQGLDFIGRPHVAIQARLFNRGVDIKISVNIR